VAQHRGDCRQAHAAAVGEDERQPMIAHEFIDLSRDIAKIRRGLGEVLAPAEIERVRGRQVRAAAPEV
jgi:hypothetical protein